MNWIVAILKALFGAWLSKPEPAAPIAEKLGRAEAERDNARVGEQAISEAHKASEAVLRGAVEHPDRLREPSADSRD